MSDTAYKKNKSLHFVFFGTSRFSVLVLEELAKAGLTPGLIVAAPDTAQGRKMIMTPPETKVWAEKNNIPVIQPVKLSEESVATELKKQKWDAFVVASYGKIIPESILNIPTRGSLNLHPSLLPLFRGPSPIQSMILDGAAITDIPPIGVTIMLMDKLMDHGPIIAQEELATPNWPLAYLEFEGFLAHHGGKTLAAILPRWVAGEITATEQDHDRATYTKKIEKEDGLIDLAAEPYTNWLKINAYAVWPGCYFKTKRKEKEIRVIITHAAYKDDKLEILKVKPEGGKEMSYKDFQNGL